MMNSRAQTANMMMASTGPNVASQPSLRTGLRRSLIHFHSLQLARNS